MKAKSGGRTFEIDETRVRGGGVARPLRERGAGARDGCASLAEVKMLDKHRSVAGSKPAPAPTKFDSKWEERYAKVLAMEQATGTIERFWYHPFSMWLPGKVRYTPDFLIQYPGHLQIVEIKGWSKNLRDGMTRLKIAASIFPCYTWTVAKWTGKEFDFIPVEVDPW